MIECNSLHSAMTPSFTIFPSLNFYPKNSIKIASNPRPRSFKLFKTSNLSSLSSSLTTPSRDRIIDFGRHKGRMLGSLPSTYLKWVSKNLRAGDYEEWARLSDDVLKDPIYKDRIEWEFAEKILNGDVLRLKYESGSTVDELLELSERFGWDNDDKLGWSRIDFGLLGTSKGGRIPRLGLESKGRVFEKMESGKKICTNGGKDGGVERRRARRERLKLRTKKIENDGGKLGTCDENVIDSSNKMPAMTVSDGNGDGSNLFPGRQSLLKKAVSHKKKIITTIPPLRPVGFVVMCDDTNPYCLWQEFIEGILNTSIQKKGKLSQDNLIKCCSSIHDCDPYCAKHEFRDKLQQYTEAYFVFFLLCAPHPGSVQLYRQGYYTLLRFILLQLIGHQELQKMLVWSIPFKLQSTQDLNPLIV
ncbi:hypothetical protein POM88_031607 [Heracleum sosnowskyi]|uniref:Uncharacterized protein n=1 Tax=Heracleum sosnowskyi TaxID=360622 RepID=A0AAD8HXR2_9APIA|nr:hypothetical protein POM88_031607 [Heracleum sosnowskyi]